MITVCDKLFKDIYVSNFEMISLFSFLASCKHAYGIALSVCVCVCVSVDKLQKSPLLLSSYGIA